MKTAAKWAQEAWLREFPDGDGVQALIAEIQADAVTTATARAEQAEAKLDDITDRIRTLADELCGMQPVLPAEEALTLVEKEARDCRIRFVNARAGREQAEAAFTEVALILGVALETDGRAPEAGPPERVIAEVRSVLRGRDDAERRAGEAEQREKTARDLVKVGHDVVAGQRAHLDSLREERDAALKRAEGAEGQREYLQGYLKEQNAKLATRTAERDAAIARCERLEEVLRPFAEGSVSIPYGLLNAAKKALSPVAERMTTVIVRNHGSGTTGNGEVCASDLQAARIVELENRVIALQSEKSAAFEQCTRLVAAGQQAIDIAYHYSECRLRQGPTGGVCSCGLAKAIDGWLAVAEPAAGVGAPLPSVPWVNAGGPNECKHGYAVGIACPDCDAAKGPPRMEPHGAMPAVAPVVFNGPPSHPTTLGFVWSGETQPTPGVLAAAMGVRGPAMTFEQAWAVKEAQGYQYGRDALEQVRAGWEMARSCDATASLSTGERRFEGSVFRYGNTTNLYKVGKVSCDLDWLAGLYGHRVTIIVRDHGPASASAQKEGGDGRL